MIKFIISAIFPLVLYIDFNPSLNFDGDISTFLVFRLEDGTKKNANSVSFDNLNFNIFEIKI